MNKHARTSAFSSVPHYAPAMTLAVMPLHITPAVQDLVQDHLHALLGKRYRVTLLGSQARSGRQDYHVQIAHEPSGLSIEHHDQVHPGVVEDLFILATQMKAMLEQRETLARMGGNGKVRLLTWISDDIGPLLLKQCEAAQQACEQALGRMQDSI